MKTKEIQIVAEIYKVLTVIKIEFEESITCSKAPKVSIAGVQPSGYIELKAVRLK